jgi:hypothetical protein
MGSAFKDWLAQPFSADMDVWHWFLFLGLIFAIAFAWGLVLREIATVAQEA